MTEVLLTIFGPLVPFVVLAVLALRFGAESRPGFDGRPLPRDHRPNL